MPNGDRTFKYIDKERFVPWLKQMKEKEIKKAQLDVSEAEFCAGRVQLIDAILDGSTQGLWDWQPSE